MVIRVVITHISHYAIEVCYAGPLIDLLPA